MIINNNKKLNNLETRLMNIITVEPEYEYGSNDRLQNLIQGEEYIAHQLPHLSINEWERLKESHARQYQNAIHRLQSLKKEILRAYGVSDEQFKSYLDDLKKRVQQMIKEFKSRMEKYRKNINEKARDITVEKLEDRLDELQSGQAINSKQLDEKIRDVNIYLRVLLFLGFPIDEYIPTIRSIFNEKQIQFYKAELNRYKNIKNKNIFKNTIPLLTSIGGIYQLLANPDVYSGSKQSVNNVQKTIREYQGYLDSISQLIYSYQNKAQITQ